MLRKIDALVLVLAGIIGAGASPATPGDTFTSLFNGKDLQGWVNVQTAPDTWTVREGMIVCSGRPTGILRTERMYENFVLELEYRHMHAGGNAGLFIWSDAITARGVPFSRSIEVQVMDGVETENYTSHGDIFSIHGSRMAPDRPHPAGWERCMPSERRAKPAPEWNHYRVTAQNGSIKLEVNGKEVSGGHSITPRMGYICLESEGSEVHFRNLRISERPSTGARGKEVALIDEGFRSIFNGRDLAGWKNGAAAAEHWQVRDWVLHYDGKGEHLWSEQAYGDFELIADWRWAESGSDVERPLILPDGTEARDDEGRVRTEKVRDAGDSGIYLRGSEKSQVNIWCWPVGSGEVYGYRTDAAMSPEVRRAVTPSQRADAPIGQWNRFRIRMEGSRLTVTLNGQIVIDRAELPGVAASGPIALQHHGNPIEFANIYVRELQPPPE